MLAEVLDTTLRQLPFPFTTGDVMGAAMTIMIHAGMIPVTKGEITKQSLSDDLLKAVKDAVAQWEPENGGVVVLVEDRVRH